MLGAAEEANWWWEEAAEVDLKGGPGCFRRFLFEVFGLLTCDDFVWVTREAAQIRSITCTCVEMSRVPIVIPRSTLANLPPSLRMRLFDEE